MKRQAREVYGFVPRRSRGPLIARLLMGAFIIGAFAGVLAWK